MRKIIVLAVFFIAFFSNSSFADGFEKIHKVNMSKDQIHNAIIEWIATTFNDPSSVIKVNDKAGGKVIVKGLVEVDGPGSHGNTLTFTRKFTMIVDIKKNKYKIKYSDFYMHDVMIDVVTEERGDYPIIAGSPDEERINLVLKTMDNHLLSFIKQYKKKANW